MFEPSFATCALRNLRFIRIRHSSFHILLCFNLVFFNLTYKIRCSARTLALLHMRCIKCNVILIFVAIFTQERLFFVTFVIVVNVLWQTMLVLYVVTTKIARYHCRIFLAWMLAVFNVNEFWCFLFVGPTNVSRPLQFRIEWHATWIANELLVTISFVFYNWYIFSLHRF